MLHGSMPRPPQGMPYSCKRGLMKQLLDGGLEHFLFSHILWKFIPIDFFFQRGWNHQPGWYYVLQPVAHQENSELLVFWAWRKSKCPCRFALAPFGVSEMAVFIDVPNLIFPVDWWVCFQVLVVYVCLMAKLGYCIYTQELKLKVLARYLQYLLFYNL